MQKVLKNYVCAFFVLAVFVFLFSGCNKSILDECQSKISDERQSYFEGETENYYVSFSSGKRESPYVLDGNSGEKVEFGVVTIKPKNTFIPQSITYNVCVNNDEFKGEFEQSPFDDTFAGDINKLVCDDDVLLIKINNGSGEEVANMQSVTKNFKVKSQKALLIALNELEDKFSSFKNKDFEIYIKIVADITNNIKDKFYLVMFLDCEKNTLNVVVNPYSGECEIKKV